MSTIKPSQIKDALDLAVIINKQKRLFVPCFSGDAGIGKSFQCQKWAKEQGPDFGFVDIRLAYMEGPDLTGLGQQVQIDGKWVTINALPDFLPKNGRGLILLEEPNRAHESTMNAMMQILTDRKIHNYSVPDGYILAACINPEGKYTVNAMDPAMKSRFVMYDVKYDHQDFLKHVKASNWNPMMIAFLESNLWVYKSADELADDKVLVCPRNLQVAETILNNRESCEPIFLSSLGAAIGAETASDLYKFLSEVKPILYSDFRADEKGALARLKKLGSGKDYAGDLISVTISSLLDAFKKEKSVDVSLLTKVCGVVPADQAVNLFLSLSDVMTEKEIESFLSKHKNLVTSIKKRASGLE